MAQTTDFSDLLTSTRISKLRTYFEGRQCDLERFVTAFVKTSASGAPGSQQAVLNPARKDESILFIRRLIELFSRIDTYGNGLITWDQFTTFAAENTLSETEGDGRPKASVIYRDDPRFQMPADQDLPATKVSCMKWVPELQQLFVTYQCYPTVFVFNHLCRMIARLHANMPPADTMPPGTQMVSAKQKAEMAEAFRAKLNLRDAMETSKFDTLAWAEGHAGAAGGRGQGDYSDSESEDGAPTRVEPVAQQTSSDDDEKRGKTAKDAQIEWANNILKAKINVAPGERMKAAQILANARCVAEARRSALLTELGAALQKNKTVLTLRQQQAVDAEIKAAYASAKRDAKRPSTADAGNLRVARVKFNPQLAEKVYEVVQLREAEAAFHRNYAMERASGQAVLLSHPAGFSMAQAERLKNMTLVDLGEAAESVLPMLGVKNAGTAQWGKTRKLMRAGMGSGPRTGPMVEDGAPKNDTRTVADVTGGKPQAAASAAMVAYDPGPNGRIHDYGYSVDTSSRHSRAKPGQVRGGGGYASADMESVKMSTGQDETAVRTRTDILALPRGSEAAEVTFLGVEYCMPVDRHNADDPKAWRQMRPSDVRHLLAVSSSELFITLWTTRTLSYSGVIHVLLPQDRMVWSTGANALFTCNSFSGPVVGWDVISGAKICSLDSHDAPVMCLADVPSLGVACTGSLDTKIGMWSYRNEADSVGGELAGIRGRAPPRPKPLLQGFLEGHGTGVMLMVAVDDPILPRLVTAAIGSEVCLWDLMHRVMLARVGSPAPDSAVNALSLTCTTPPYAVTVDEGNSVRLWSIDAGSTGGGGLLDQLDAYRLPDMPANGINSIIVPKPHPHIVVGGNHVILMGPTAPGMESQGIAEPGGGAPKASSPVSALYSTEMGLFLIADGTNVSIWDARTGAHKRTLKDVLPELLVSMTLDGSQRKILVGDAGGDMSIVNILDGRKLAKAINTHTDDVTRICVQAEDQIAITCSWDRSIRVWDMSRENGAKKGELPVCRLVENAHAADITAMDVSRGLGLVATGSADGTLRVWDYCSLDLSCELVGHQHGITSIVFPGPGVMPLLVSADDGGFIYVWAVRGSNYNDRLLLGLRNLGRAGGPPAPNLKVIDLAALKAERDRRKVASFKGGIVQLRQASLQDNKDLKDEGLKSLFSSKRSENESAQRQQAMLDVLKHQAAQEKGAAREASELHTTLQRSSSALDRLAGGGHGGEASGSPSKSSLKSTRTAAAEHEPKHEEAGEHDDLPSPDLSSSEDSVPVPVSCMFIFCRPVRKGQWEDSESKSIDVDTPMVFKIFTGDGQGMLKQWDISSHINKFCRGGRTGIGTIPPSKLAYNATAWSPRLAKHHVYPTETPAAFDPEVEARRAATAEAMKQLSRLRYNNSEAVISEDVERMQSVLATLRMRRTMYSALHPVKPIPKTTVKIGAFVEGLDKADHELAVVAAEEARAAAKAEKARKAQELAEAIERVRQQEAEARSKEDDDAVANGTMRKTARPGSATTARPSTATSGAGGLGMSGSAVGRPRPMSAQVGSSRGRLAGGGVAGGPSALSSPSAASASGDASRTPRAPRISTIPEEGDEDLGSLASPTGRVSPTKSGTDTARAAAAGVSQPMATVPKTAPEYPKVKKLIGAVVYQKFQYRPKNPPLIPTLVRPSPDAPRTVAMYGDGMELEPEDEHRHSRHGHGHHGHHGHSPRPFLPTGLAATPMRDPMGDRNDGAAAPPKSSRFAQSKAAEDESAAFGRPGFKSLHDEISQELQDDLWYTFGSDKPEYSARKSEIRSIAESEAAMRGWEDKREHRDDMSGSGATPRSEFSPRSPPPTPVRFGLGIGTKAAKEAVKYAVPDVAWITSRLRLDIRPVSRWTGHVDLVTSVRFIPDPVALLSTSMDGSTRLWTPNGLPIGVVSAPPRNVELERAMAAAASIAQTAGGSGTSGGAEEPFANKIPRNLSKEECLWQFVPNDEEKIEKTTKTAVVMLGRITTFKPNRRASVQLTSDVSVNLAAVSAPSNGVAASMTAVLNTVYQMGRRPSKGPGAHDESAGNKLLLAAKAATVAAEALHQRLEGKPAASAHGSAPDRAGPAGRADDEASVDEAASKALDMALITAIDTWDEDGKGRRGSTRPSSAMPASSPVRIDMNMASGPGVTSHARVVTDADMLRRYGHMAAEVQRKALESKIEDEEFRHMPAKAVKDMRAMGILPQTEGQEVMMDVTAGSGTGMASQRPGSAAGARPTSAAGVRPTSAAGVRPASAAGARPTTAGGTQRPTITLQGAGTTGAGGMQPPAEHAPQATPTPTPTSARFHGLTGLQAGQLEAELRASREAEEFEAVQEKLAKERAAIRAAGRPGSARPGTARPGSARPGSASALARPGSASLPSPAHMQNLQGMVSRLRVTTAAAAAGFELEQKLGVSTPDDAAGGGVTAGAAAAGAGAGDPTRPDTASTGVSRPQPSGGEGLAVAGLRMFPSRPATRAATADTYASDPVVAPAEDVPQAESVAPDSPQHRLASTLSKTSAVLAEPVNQPPHVHPHVRARTDDLLAAAEMLHNARMEKLQEAQAAAEAAERAAQGLPPKKASPAKTGRSSLIRPATALPRLHGAANMEALFNTSSTLKSLKLDEIPDTGLDVFGGLQHGKTSAEDGDEPGEEVQSSTHRSGGFGLDMSRVTGVAVSSVRAGAARPASAAMRPGTAVRVQDVSMTTGRSTSPWRNTAVREKPPPGLRSYEAIMWPYREYSVPKSFGGYPRFQVDKFRGIWNALDADKSGQVDIEELLNAKVFSAATLKVTKALFGTIDEDKSGTVSLQEMLKVMFPMCDGDHRAAIARYMRYLDAKEKAAVEKARVALEEIGDESVSPGSALKAKPSAVASALAQLNGPGGSSLGLEPTDSKGRPKAPPSGKAGMALTAMARSRDARSANKAMRLAMAEGKDGDGDL